MGVTLSLLDKLLGVQKKLNLSEHFLDIERAGGKGISPLGYDLLASVLTAQGCRRERLPDGISVVMQLGGQPAQISVDRGTHQGLKKDQALVRVTRCKEFWGHTFLERSLQVAANLDPFISSTDDAYTVAWHLLKQSNLIYINSWRELGKLDVTPSTTLQVPLIQKFVKQVARDGELKVQYMGLSPQLNFPALSKFFATQTAELFDPEIQIELNYMVVTSIIDTWKLVD